MGQFWACISFSADLHLFRCVIFGCPVRYSTHPHFTIPKLLTERSILGLRVSTSVGVVEGDVKEKWPLFIFYIPFILFCLTPLFKRFLFMGLEKLADQEFDAGDVPPHLQDRVVFLCVGIIEGIYGSRTDVLLPNNTWESKKKVGGGGEMVIKSKGVCENTLQLNWSLCYWPVCTLALLRSSGRLWTPSNELKWWTSWWSPYMPFWCWQHIKQTLIS